MVCDALKRWNRCWSESKHSPGTSRYLSSSSIFYKAKSNLFTISLSHNNVQFIFRWTIHSHFGTTCQFPCSECSRAILSWLFITPANAYHRNSEENIQLGMRNSSEYFLNKYGSWKYFFKTMLVVSSSFLLYRENKLHFQDKGFSR